MATKKLSIDDLFRVKMITGVRLAPDGRHAAVGVRSVNEAEQENVDALWLWRREDDSFEQMTRGPADANPVWLNPTTLLFTASKREKGEEESDKPFRRTRLYTMSVRGGEPVLRATLDGVVWGMEISPDGKRAAMSYSPNPPADPRQKKVWVKTPPPAVPAHLHWKLDGLGALPEKRPSIHLLKTTGRRWGRPEPLVDDPRFWDTGLQWADDRRLVFVRWNPDRKDMCMDIMLSGMGGKPRVLATPGGYVFGLAPSPDGRQVLFCGNEDPWRGGYLPAPLYARSIKPADKSWRMVRGSDGKMGTQLTISDVFTVGAGTPFRWLDERHVVGLHTIHGHTELVRICVETGESEALAGRRGVVQQFDAAGGAILYAWGDCRSPGELYRPGRKRPVSRLNTSLSRRFDIVPERWNVRTEKGVRVDTFLYATPRQLQARRHSLPLVIYVHGGPMCQTGEGAFHEYVWLAHRGFPVLALNPRGSIGYGAEHGVAIYGNWGERDAHDVLAVRRSALRRYPQFDPDRTFIAGGSYGGYMVNWMLSRRPGVFRAGIAQRSICNHVSFLGTCDFSTHFAASALGLENIWEDPARAWELSPIAQAPRVRDPLLLIHSENDLRCPMGQAEEMFVALLELGKKINEDVRLVVFRQESHGLSRGGRPENRRVRLQEILAWLKQHNRPRKGR